MKIFRHVLKGFLVDAVLLCVMNSMAGCAAVDSSYGETVMIRKNMKPVA